MKYYTLGIFLFFSSFVTILFSIFFGSLTLPIEKNIESIQLTINFFQDKIKINNLEYAAHHHPKYLEKLEKIYLFNEYNQEVGFNIIRIQEFSSMDLGKVIQVNSN